MPASFRILIVLCLLTGAAPLFGQQAVIRGTITDSVSLPVADVSLQIKALNLGTITNAQGTYSLKVPAGSHVLLLRHVEYNTLVDSIQLQAGDTLELNYRLQPQVRLLQQVEISGNLNEADRREAGLTRLDPQTAKAIPSAFGDFTRILATLPGVVSNNELSASYSVRGGNYDENLVYVNDIPVYRPFLVRSGQQEGLSFINPDLVSAVAFSSGGWQAKYGDKLSSSLNVTYKNPVQTRASMTAGLLGGAVHLEGSTAGQRLSYLIGSRLKSAQYLLNTLETNGQYLPRFVDMQSYLQIDIDGDADIKRTELGLLTAFASNRYLVRPESRETTFGTWQQPFRLNVFYDGQETLSYRTFQQGAKLAHRFSEQWSTQLMVSWVNTQEREYFDLFGAYYLCEVAFDAQGRQTNDCATVLGTGGNYAHARNKLVANIFNLESRTVYAINPYHTLEFGLGYAYESFDDQLQQYDFSDSADYVYLNQSIYNHLDLHGQRFFGFVQNTFEPSEEHTLNIGIRTHYWSVNRQWLLSPRLQYAYQPEGLRDVVFRLAGGLYQQPPFYRELRNLQGELQTNIRAQSALHAIAGMDYRFLMFGREFSFMAELYYKHLSHVIPYDVDNVRIRYYANNNASAYAAGADFRISGEFLEGAESWFSLGILRTREDIAGDGRGDIRRPTDQLVNLGVFFQDHFPNDPTSRVYVSLLYGTGLPYGPPQSLRYRNTLNGPDYKRVDIGFSKQLFFREEKTKNNAFLRSLWIGAEVLNVLGADNTISFTWITDVNNNQYAVPNRLSARFLNIKLIARY